MQQSKVFTSVALAVIGILLIGGIALYSQKGAMPAPATTDTNTPTTPTDTQGPPPMSTRYKDGTYSADGSYVSPGGRQVVSVTVTLKNDLITDVQMVVGAVDPVSKQFQEKFIGGIKQQVVGKDISSLSVHVVSGSSLTAGGFNDAIAKIQAQAQA